ncbi:aminotransferase class IV family protein [Qaidamihabitans albus]|uniref:aminotransferase class IV family protein n=1 Tax=Qaidamihabitans albus TaxID=2795733 RepID=UPI0018F19526|nr:aminotransferase class IV family protein [Qaidamihabitans albus]
MRAEVNGAPATAEQLAVPAVVNYGHFTSMQVRGGRVRGLEAHLRRLAEGTRLLFGGELDTGLVRRYLRHAVTGTGPVTARVTIFSLAAPRGGEPGSAAPPDVLVALRPPSEAAAGPLRLRSVHYERVLPRVKHVGTFGLFHHTRAARQAGYDDALFVTSDAHVSEASVWNAGFFDGGTVIWPRAPMLGGVTQALLSRGLDRLGVPTVTRPVPLAEARTLRSAFLCNAGCACRPVAGIDDTALTVDPELTALLERAYDTNPWEPV